MPARLLLAGTLQAEALRAPRSRRGALAHAPTSICSHDGTRDARGRPRRHPEPRARARRSRDARRSTAGRDTSADAAWTQAVARRPCCAQIDRFHPIPDAPAWADSWAEWLYFNGRVGRRALLPDVPRRPATRPTARRAAGVRLQLERGGRMEIVQRAAQTLHRRRVGQRPGPDDRRELGPARRADATASTSICAGRDGARLTGDLTLAGDAGPAGAADRDHRAPAAGAPATSCR